jgi:hypothetical protein
MAPFGTASARRAAGELSFNSEMENEAGAFDHDLLHTKARKMRK